MKRTLGVLFVLGTLAGCATPQQNAALAGAIVGAAVVSSAYQPRPVYVQPRPAYCTSTPVVVGYDYYRRPIYQYRQYCR